jgi:hypothetical protein
VGAHLLHEPREALDLTEQGGLVQVPENLLAVAHGVGIVQVAEQHSRDQVALLAIPRDRRHDLVQVQVSGEWPIRALLGGAPGRRFPVKQQAGEIFRTFWR